MEDLDCGIPDVLENKRKQCSLEALIEHAQISVKIVQQGVNLAGRDITLTSLDQLVCKPRELELIGKSKTIHLNNQPMNNFGTTVLSSSVVEVS